MHWRQSGLSLSVLLRLSPEYVRTVAGDECALDPDRFDIQDCFVARDPHIEDLGRLLLAGLELERTDSHLYVDTLTCDLAIHLLRRYTTASNARAWPKAELSPHKLRRAIQYIDENLRNQLTLSSIANAVTLSPGHFAHAFRQATGVAPHRYVLELRVNRAKALLRQSDLPITEIADRVGCSSHSHFSRALPPRHGPHAAPVSKPRLTDPAQHAVGASVTERRRALSVANRVPQVEHFCKFRSAMNRRFSKVFTSG